MSVSLSLCKLASGYLSYPRHIYNPAVRLTSWPIIYVVTYYICTRRLTLHTTDVHGGLHYILQMYPEAYITYYRCTRRLTLHTTDVQGVYITYYRCTRRLTLHTTEVQGGLHYILQMYKEVYSTYYRCTRRLTLHTTDVQGGLHYILQM